MLVFELLMLKQFQVYLWLIVWNDQEVFGYIYRLNSYLYFYQFFCPYFQQKTKTCNLLHIFGILLELNSKSFLYSTIQLKEKETNMQNDDYLLCFGAENYFFKDTFSFNSNLNFYNFQTSLKNIFIKKNFLKWKVINLFLIIDVVTFKKNRAKSFLK